MQTRNLLIFMALAFTACTEPQGEWSLVRGSHYKHENVAEIERGKTTAGGIITLLGTPYFSKDNRFMYAAQYTRPVERNYGLFRREAIERVTLQTMIFFHAGIVIEVQSDRKAQIYAPGAVLEESRGFRDSERAPTTLSK
jgi:outer membrane protein assembly factor BamE (lipoprotein component of BamABCDE complex)